MLIPDLYTDIEPSVFLPWLSQRFKTFGLVEGVDSAAVGRVQVKNATAGKYHFYWVEGFAPVEALPVLDCELNGFLGTHRQSDLIELQDGERMVYLEHDGNGSIGEIELFELFDEEKPAAEKEKLRAQVTKQIGEKAAQVLWSLGRPFADREMVEGYLTARIGKIPAPSTPFVKEYFYPYRAKSTDSPVVHAFWQKLFQEISEKKEVTVDGLGDFNVREIRGSGKPFWTFSADEIFLGWLNGKGKLKVDSEVAKFLSPLVAEGPQSVTAPGLMQIITHVFAGYEGRNPRTGETIKVPPKKIPMMIFEVNSH